MQTHAKSFLDCPLVAAWLSNPTTTRPDDNKLNRSDLLFHHTRGVTIQACPPPPISYARTPPKFPKKHLFVPVDVCDAHGHILGYDTGSHHLLPGSTTPHVSNGGIFSKFALDGGRKTAMAFQHQKVGNETGVAKNGPDGNPVNTNGNLAVSIDSFDEIGDSVVEVRHFRTPTAYTSTATSIAKSLQTQAHASSAKSPAVIPHIMATSKIFHRRDCTQCTAADRPCTCKNDARLRLLLREKKKKAARAKCDNADNTDSTDRIYPAWKFTFDAYVDAHLGHYIIQVQHTTSTPGNGTGNRNKDWASFDFHLAYRAIFRRMDAVETRDAINEFFSNSIPSSSESKKEPCDDCTISVTADNRVLKSSHITHSSPLAAPSHSMDPPAKCDGAKSNADPSLVCHLSDLKEKEREFSTAIDNGIRPKNPTPQIDQVVDCCCVKVPIPSEDANSTELRFGCQTDNDSDFYINGHCKPCRTNTIIPSVQDTTQKKPEILPSNELVQGMNGIGNNGNGACAPTFQFLELEEYSIAPPPPKRVRTIPTAKPSACTTGTGSNNNGNNDSRAPSPGRTESDACTSLLCSDFKCCSEIPYGQPVEWSLPKRPVAASNDYACNNMHTGLAVPQEQPSPCMCTPSEKEEEKNGQVQDTITGDVQIVGDIHNTVRESNVNYLSRCKLGRLKIEIK